MRELSCEQARQLLGASRRDDWTTEDLTALSQHLASCPACRKAQAEYREVGELVRQLSSVVPPPSFRASVFAAIEADQQRIRRRQMHGAPAQVGRPAAAAALARLAGARPDPGLAAVHASGARSSANRPPVSISRRVVSTARENTRIMAGLAAMLLVALLGVTLVPASPFFLFGSTSSAVAQYSADAHISSLSAAGASNAWLVYAGPASTGGGALVFAQPRNGGAPLALISTASASPITVYAVTSGWAIWGTGDSSGWNVAATALPSGQTTTLLDSSASGPGAPAALHGIWASGNRALAAVTTRSGTGMLVQFDLSSGAPAASVIARSSSGAEFANPSFDGTNYYWANLTEDASGALHSTVWRGADSSHAQQVDVGDEAFAPVVASGALLWVAASSAPKVGSGGLEAALAGVTGAVQEQRLSGGQLTQLGAGTTAGSLRADGPMALWQSGGKTYTYNLNTHAASAVDSQIRDAAVVGLSDSALVWAPAHATTLDVYNLAK